MGKFLCLGIYVSLAFCHAGCALLQRGESQSTSFAKYAHGNPQGVVTQAELQDDLLRFESQFNAQIQNANQALEASGDPKIRYRALTNRLIYSSNSLNIALGPNPESNLLDMVTFIELSRDVLEKYWIPKVFRADGQALDRAFIDSKQQIWGIAEKVLNAEHRKQLENVIMAWRDKHPEQINVETVRISAFSNEAGAKAAGLNQYIGGLFASVQQSTAATDSARLFAERILYYAERAPYLFRLHASLGADELMDSADSSLAQLADSMGHGLALRSLLKEFQQAAFLTQASLREANTTVQSVNTLMNHMSDNPQTAESAMATISQLTVLLREWNHLQTSAPNEKSRAQLDNIAKLLDQESKQLLVRLGELGASLIVFFGATFVISKLIYQYLLRKFFVSEKKAEQKKQERRAA